LWKQGGKDKNRHHEPLKVGFPLIPANPGSGPGQAPESSYFKKFWTPAFAGVTI
jgi:hypothetical protein